MVLLLRIVWNLFPDKTIDKLSGSQKESRERTWDCWMRGSWRPGAGSRHRADGRLRNGGSASDKESPLADVVSLWHVIGLILEVPKGVGINSLGVDYCCHIVLREKARKSREVFSAFPAPSSHPL